MPTRPFLIGVAGGSSSGKTTVAERLAELAGAKHLALIKLDSYYVALSDHPIEVRKEFNYDHPDAFDWPLLNDHLAALAAGAAVPVPIYDYVEYRRSEDVRVVSPAEIVVVEGILVLWEPSLRERFDLKVFLDTDADLRLIRRLQRDVAERGRSADSVIDQYLATVRPAHEQFIEPSKRYADVIIPNGGLNRPALECCWRGCANSPRRPAEPVAHHVELWLEPGFEKKSRLARTFCCVGDSTSPDNTGPGVPPRSTTRDQRRSHVVVQRSDLLARRHGVCHGAATSHDGGTDS